MPLGNSSNRIPGFQQIRRLRLLGPVSLEQPGVTRIHLGLAGPLETRIGPVFREINEIGFFVHLTEIRQILSLLQLFRKAESKTVPSVSTNSHLPEYMRNYFLLFTVFWPNLSGHYNIFQKNFF